MPGIVTHHMFGVDVYGSCSQLIGETQDVLDAFLLGNLGPDPFFYLAATPLTRKYRRIGQVMHRQRTQQLLFAIHERFIAGEPGCDNPACKAYAMGFLCHYLLDSTVHPLVYAQQHAICRTGLEGLTGEWPHRVVHATIETSLDEYVLTTRLGATAATLPPHKTMLRCSTPVLVSLSHAFSPALKDTYDLRVPLTAYTSAVSLNRLAQQALDSKSAGLRQRFDYLAGLGMASSYVLALSHRGSLNPRTPFTNDDHVPWEVPFAESTVINLSFNELFSQALQRAKEVLPLYAQAGFDLDACTAFTANVNFLGRPVEH
ncbi:MAG: zinc dependent phospholipase C family protein [Eggerthellaceae bacterium]|nr:zinc dependent phospholipase C family protein [Eggerthellaceae bacterium]